MHVIAHTSNGTNIAEVRSENLLIAVAEDGLDLLGTVYYEGYDRIVLHAANITPAFFDLKTGMAGEVLQKFSNYRVRLAIVGDFSSYNSNSLRDFIFESNKGKQVCFVGTVEEALERMQ